MNVQQFSQRLARGEAVILDGGCGTELGRLGIDTPAPLWSAAAMRTMVGRRATAAVHDAYIAAGARIITTNTFRTQRPTWEAVGAGDEAAEATISACRIARGAAAVAGGVLVVGSATSIEDCYRPEGKLTDRELAAAHTEHAANLRRGGVDLLLAETIPSIREGHHALAAAEEVGLPRAISAYCEQDSNGELRLPSGERLRDAVPVWGDFKPLFVGVNCVPTEVAEAAVAELRSVTRPNLPIAVYANGLGIPDDTPDAHAWLSDDANREPYTDSARRWLAAGAQIIGGCCLTTPDHIQDLTALVNARSTGAPVA